ncbi:MAG: hypothetical protein HY824_15275 [Acidobacteria bacterium]|nr:hypothetical protein [Acidobacteriota bacterium]
MRVTAFILALGLCAAAPAAAQEWDEYVSRQDGFKLNFPGQPKISETTWKSQMDYTLPARVYATERGRERYSMTVVDYRGIEKLGIERAKACPPGNAQCRENAGIMGPGYWKHDERAAVMHATFLLLQRNAKLTNLAWEWQDMVEGNLIQLTNADQSRTFAYVTMHENKLFVMEGTVPAGNPEPGLFQQSLGWVDSDGNGIRYQEIVYSNAYHGMGVYPKPRVGGQGRGAGAGPGGAAPAPGR